ncbi:putative permease YicO [Rubripirellula tenax]|uniref:Putative permease YicO n=1 Tax=Rubripirellula tenax TaxID=2528015 RepID=A0A5C6F5Q0_9BACT|nr:NCS2 family permease [Rubripirellula tenax]TWU54801.1 putative permease YicO [Rubripirellula tenax]
MLEKINQYFEVEKLGSSLRIEILAGLSTFLSLAYIVVVNPAILAEAGMDKSFVLFATVITSAVAMFVMGAWARHPFALAPGLEMNAYVAFVVVGAMGFNWQQALGAVFWSGVLFIVVTLLNVRTKIIQSIPDKMKFTLSLSVGVFLILIGLKLSELLTFDGIYVNGIGDFTSHKAIALYLGVGLILILQKVKFRAAVLVSIILAAIYCNYMGLVEEQKAAELSSAMFSGIFKLDISVLWTNPKIIIAIIVLFLVDFYGSIAKFIGLTINTSIASDDGTIPRMKEALSVDGIATLGGSCLGTTSVTTYVESAVGIGAGGRTGITAIVCGMLMLSCLIITPFLKFIPVVATTGALVVVGIQLCPRLEILKKYNKLDIAVSVIMPILVVFTFSLEKAMLAGFGIYLIAEVVKERKFPNPYLLGSVVLLAIGVVLQYV